MTDQETIGFDELDKIFDRFQYADKRNIIISAYLIAVRPTVDLAASLAPRKTGGLSRSIGAIPDKAINESRVFVGARLKRPWRGGFGYMMEYGTKIRYKKNKKRSSTGQVVIPQPGFLYRAADATEQQVMDSVSEQWYAAIERWIR
jgi:hypothetical protein